MISCACGCGQPTRLATRTDRRNGHVAGQPLRFLHGHYAPSGPDLVGRQFGRLTVTSRAERVNLHGDTFWICRCACGAQREVRGAELARGESKSCGCLVRDMLRQRSTTHGLASRGQIHPLYAVWSQMKARCFNPRNPDYPRYGGRGITVRARWRASFADFVSDMGPRPEGYSLDRIDNDGHYEPGNVRWATPVEQANNVGAYNRYVIVGARRLTVAAAARTLGVNYHALWGKVRRGRAFTINGTPVEVAS